MAFVSPPVLLGVLTDIQHAVKPDHPLEDPIASETSPEPAVTPWRSYSTVLQKTKHAIQHLNAKDVEATLHLGDIIDGNDTLQATQDELDAVVTTLAPINSPVMHVIGNHCLSAGRDHLLEALNLPQAYYYRDFSSRWRLVVLDTVDVGIDREEGHPYRQLAEDFLASHRGQSHAKPWNGAVGPAQLKWLRHTLADAAKLNMMAIVCGHMPLLTSDNENVIPQYVVWNYDDLLDILHEYAAVVKAYFAGHFHCGAYVFRDDIHHVTFESVLDSQSEEGSWGIVALYEDRIVIDGHGDMSCRELKLR